MLNIFKRNKPKKQEFDTHMPKHVAIIMDGNGRWANGKGLNRIAGHRKGAEAVKNAIKGCIDNQIPYLTIFAFSSENWNRPENEIKALMALFVDALQNQITKLDDNEIKVQMIGDLSKFNDDIQQLAKQAESDTAQNSKLTLSVAVNYGGRWDIVEACKGIASKVKSGELDIEQIDEQLIDHHLATYSIPDPDFLIRTSGEYRISNFLLWQTAYSELYFTDVLWPDFDEQVLSDALTEYARRDRRYGKAIDQVPLEDR